MAEYQQLQIEERGDSTIVHFRQPRVSGILEMEKLERELHQLVEKENRRRLVVDLSVVEFLSSQIFGTLVSLNSRLKAHGGGLRLCNIQPQVLDVLLTCKLDRVFDIKTDLDAALQAV
jgi:anti-sigma B factor antagonist